MIQVGIHEINVQQHVIFLHGRTEQQRLLSIEGEFKSGQKASPFVVEALRPKLETADVTISVKHAEGISLLENLNVAVAHGERGNDVELIIPRIEFIHRSLSL